MPNLTSIVWPKSVVFGESTSNYFDATPSLSVFDVPENLTIAGSMSFVFLVASGGSNNITVNFVNSTPPPGPAGSGWENLFAYKPAEKTVTINAPSNWTGPASVEGITINKTLPAYSAGGGGGGGGVDCFVSGTRILSQNGYKPIEKFTNKDFLVTCDNRTIDFKLHKTTIGKTDETTAPYVIQPHAFGRNKPLAPLYLSPTHKIQIRKGLWTSPQTAAKTNTLITRMPFGQSVTYYHIECENYLRDNVIAEGVVAESYGITAAKKAVGKFYTWNQKLGGYTRQGYAMLNNTISNM
jgi:hypothetical protein